jgi:hypothetical protein
MPELDTADLRNGATNIHSIGPVRAAGLLTLAADEIDNLRRELAAWHEQAQAHVMAWHLTKLTSQKTPVLSAESLAAANGRRVEIARAHIVGEERGCPPGSCAASPRCRNRAEMRANHGTPEQFIAAISRAAPELLGSEAERAIVTYNAAWAAATEPSAEVQRALNSELAAMGCDPASATQAEFKRALWEVMKTKAVAEELQAAELVPPAERSSTMARIERWKKRQPTTPGAETYDFTPEQEAEAAEQAERFQGLDDSDRE